ncbi:MAG: outer membrane protein transport protein, partial [Pseudomonadota bacterium]
NTHMKKILTTTAAVALTASSAAAGGLDRTGLFLGDLFAEGSVVKLSFGSVNPSISGTGFAAVGGGTFNDVGNNYTQTALSFKNDLNDRVSYLVSIDQPYGVDVEYPGSGAATALGGTMAKVDSSAVTFVGRYKFGNGFSVHGGLRAQKIEGEVTLSGLAYGAANGYNLNTESGTEVGYLVGGAYERPDIALRIALTYNSDIEYELDAVDLSGAHIVETSTPESWNLEFQSGVAEDTLVFGSIRWAAWGDFSVPAAGLGGVDLVDLDDSTDYVLGVARRFNESLVGLVSLQYEAEGDPLVSPLAPTNGKLGITIGGQYALSDGVTLSGGVNYTRLGDAQPQTADTARADFTDNDSVGIGFSVAYNF